MLDPTILIGPSQPAVANIPNVDIADALTESVERLEKAEAESRILASIVEIQSQIDAAAGLPDAALLAARSLQQSLPASRVLIAWRSNTSKGCQIIADSEMDNASPSSVGQVNDGNRLAESAAEESAARATITCWPADGNKNRHALMAVTQFANSLSAKSLLAGRLVDDQGNNRGCVLAIGTIDPFDCSAKNQLDASRQPLATKLASVERSQPTRAEKIIRGATEFLRGEKRKFAIVIAIAIGALMLLPLRYRISATCQLQPVQRRFVAAPFDGPLDAAMVRPGDIVSKGDLLARINPREIEYKLAGVRADLSRAEQEKKGLMAQHDIAGSNIAGLEFEQLRLETELLEYRRTNLEIRSPLAGVVVAGDLKQSEGTPLTRGETLFEIAPLGEMVVEIDIAEEDFQHVRSGMAVEFFVHAIPDRRLHGELGRIHPKAELVDHENVFIGEVRIRDPENVLRPGMRGRAWISGDRHPLGWNLFHKAYYALRSTVGW